MNRPKPSIICKGTVVIGRPSFLIEIGTDINQADPLMKKQMSWKKILGTVMIAAVTGLVNGCSEQRPEIEPTATPAVDIDTIAVDTGVGWVSVEGMLVPLREAPLTVPLSGQVAKIFVSEGERILNGDPLLQLDTADQEILLQQARGGVAQAEANLESARAELASAQADMEVVTLEVEAAEAELAFLEAGPTTEQIAISESAVNAAEAVIAAAAGNQSLVLEETQPAQILAAESQLLLAQATEKQLRDALNQAEGDEKLLLENQLQAAVANVNAAQAVLNDLQSGAGQSERLSAGSAVAQARAQRDAAQAQLESLRAGASDKELEIARVNVQQSEAALARAEIAEAQAEIAVARAEADHQQAQSAYEAAQMELDKMTLETPFDGTVAEITYRLGEVASPGTPAVTIADFDGWLVETLDLNERDVVALAVGFPAEIRLDALPGETLTGTVAKISPTSTVESGDVRYMVTIKLDDPADLPLRWGMTAQVDIETAQ